MLARYSPVVFTFALWIIYLPFGINARDNIIIGFLALALGRLYRPLYNVLLPAALTALVYQAQVFFIDSLRGAIHVREPQRRESLFIWWSEPEAADIGERKAAARAGEALGVGQRVLDR